MAYSNPKCKQRQARYILTTFSDFILEIVAVFLGVFTAFWLDRYREDKAERREATKVLRLIRREVSENKELLGVMQGIPAGTISNARPMRGIWDGLTERLVLVRNDDLFTQATLLYFLQANLDKMIEMYEQHAAEYQYADSVKKAAMGGPLSAECKHFVEYLTNYVLPQIDRVLMLIDTELGIKVPKNAITQPTKVDNPQNGKNFREPTTT